MRAAILTVGTEILFGQTVNTNAAFLSKELQNLGLNVMYHYTVGDNPGRLKELLAIAYRDCDLIIATGGLGPTQDDLTKEVICEYFEDSLVEFPQESEKLKAHFKKAGYRWTENNIKQAFFPKTATILRNSVGTAPGFYLKKDKKMIAALPGPPREMKRMFSEELVPLITAESREAIYYKIIRTFGIGESSLETLLMPLIDGQTDPTVATYAKEGECSLRITSKRETLEEAKDEVDRMIDKVNRLVGQYIYSYDDEDLNQVVGKLLLEKGISFSCCESCTGGMLAQAITEVPGISAVFDRGLVTYSKEAKMSELGVKAEVIEEFTAESPQVCAEMVDGLKRKTGSDLCVSITGIAGPEDLSEERPAGLAYIGINYKDETRVITSKHRNVSRHWNRNYMLLKMLNEIYLTIK